MKQWKRLRRRLKHLIWPSPIDARTLAVEAIEDEQVIQFGYTKPGGEKAERFVSPYEVKDFEGGVELVVGYDHSREDIRSFRFDRMSKRPQRCELLQYEAPTA